MKTSPIRPVVGYSGWRVEKRDPAVREFITRQTVASVYRHIIDQAKNLGAPFNINR